jgi:hypothetical protein
MSIPWSLSTYPGLEPATSRHVSYCLNQLCYRVSPHNNSNNNNNYMERKTHRQAASCASTKLFSKTLLSPIIQFRLHNSPPFYLTLITIITSTSLGFILIFPLTIDYLSNDPFYMQSTYTAFVLHDLPIICPITQSF